MPTWTIPGDDPKVVALEHARESLPRLLREDETRELEIENAHAEAAAMGVRILIDLLRQTYIQTAEGIWLDQHARDRGKRRQENESDASLRERLRKIVSSVTPAAILQAAQDILDAAQPALGTIAMVELPRDAMFLLDTPTVAGDAAGFGFWSDARSLPVTDGFGFRFDDTPPGHFILILPTGTTAATQAAILDEIRILRAAGIKYEIEVAS